MGVDHVDPAVNLSVGNGVSLGNVRFNRGVYDLFAGGEFDKLFKLSCPAVFLTECKGLARCSAVGIELNGDAVGADSVVVIAVDPGLGNAKLCPGRLVGVGYVVAVIFGGIALNGLFSHGIDYFNAAVPVTGKLNGIVPVVNS